MKGRSRTNRNCDGLCRHDKGRWAVVALNLDEANDVPMVMKEHAYVRRGNEGGEGESDRKKREGEEGASIVVKARKTTQIVHEITKGTNN